jgi:hypothetical protein
MTDVHTYVHQQDCASHEGYACNCVNGCAARVRSTDMWGGRQSTTTLWCGAPERSPYHHSVERKAFPTSAEAAATTTVRADTPRNSGEHEDG